MTCYVMFLRPQGIGSINAPGVGYVRAKEAVTVPGTTTNTVRKDEAVVIYNGESGAVMVAHGTTPDAAATVSTGLTSAGFTVPAGQNSIGIRPREGETINIKALA